MGSRKKATAKGRPVNRPQKQLSQQHRKSSWMSEEPWSTSYHGYQPPRTLQEEAMATTQHHQLGCKGPTRFRHLPVSFVRGGQYEPSVRLAETHPDHPDGAEEDMATASNAALTLPVGHVPASTGTRLERANPVGPDQEGGTIDEPLPSMMKTTIQESIDQYRSASPAWSASSQDLIVFEGREDLDRSASSTWVGQSGLGHDLTNDDALSRGVATKLELVSSPGSRSQSGHEEQRAKAAVSDSEEERLADYLANMKQHGEDQTDILPPPAGLLPAESKFKVVIDGDVSQQSRLVAEISEWRETSDLDSEDQSDDDDLGSQILVKSDNSLDFDWEDNSNDGEDDDEDEQHLRVDDAVWQGKTRPMSDRQLARLRSKREELAVASKDLIDWDDGVGLNTESPPVDEPRGLRSGTAFGISGTTTETGHNGGVVDEDDADDDDDDDGVRGGLERMKRRRETTKGKGKQGKQAMTEKENKGKKGAEALPFGVSDDELAAEMQATWAKDRYMKAARKKQRQDLHAQGLLGKKKKRRTKREKEEDQANIECDDVDLIELKTKVRLFVLSHEAQLTLSSLMDLRTRRFTHELAHVFGLTSKSVGPKTARYTTLFKTLKSTQMTEYDLDEIEARVSNKWWYSLITRKALEPDVKKVRRRWGAKPVSAASYKDGDVVGAHAAEIGIENRGRAMLERMGWSQGTALGTADNQGILQPIKHIVKTSKLGLG